ncbi:MAG: TIGR03118 family protein [Nibricoccus sp.]
MNQNPTHAEKKFFVPAFVALSLCLLTPTLHAQLGFIQTNLVSDIPGMAAVTDARLVNPWGISYGPGGPFWISDAGTGLSTVYNTAGAIQAPVSTIPNPAGGISTPTGQVFNGGTAFNSDRFIFATEQGTIAGWRGALGTGGETLFNNSAQGAIYKGLAISTIGANTYLYATDFHNGRIDIFSNAGAPVLAGNFISPSLPAGYAPFNVQNLGGKLYVTYALQDANRADDVAGAGHGFVDVFDLNGVFQQRLIVGGVLNSPWGVAIAPNSFGSLAGSLLVGNFGDGTINAFDILTGAYRDVLRDINGKPIVNEGLWGLIVGNGGNGGDANSLYITAGISGGGDIEDHGLFARITPVPEPGTLLAGATLGLFCVIAIIRRRSAPVAKE